MKTGQARFARVSNGGRQSVVFFDGREPSVRRSRAFCVT
jgi:hypothetical protein